MNKYNIQEQNIDEVLLRESLQIPNGFYEEVYFNKETNEISFSSQMTQNSWTRSDDKVGGITSYDISELEGWKTIDDDFVEVVDDANETDPSFKDKEYERYYEDSSIITKEDAIDRIVNYIIDYDTWYPEIKESIAKIKGADQ
jgi:hypothetical protein